MTKTSFLKTHSTEGKFWSTNSANASPDVWSRVIHFNTTRWCWCPALPVKPPKINTLPPTTVPQDKYFFSRVGQTLIHKLLSGSNLSTMSNTPLSDAPPIAYRKFLSATAHTPYLATAIGATSSQTFVTGLYLWTLLLACSPSFFPPITYKYPWKLTTLANCNTIVLLQDFTGIQEFSNGLYCSIDHWSGRDLCILYNLPWHALMLLEILL